MLSFLMPNAKSRLLCYAVVAVSSLLAVGAMADESLSPAEQAALAAQQGSVSNDERLIALCHHVLLHGGDEEKAALLGELGDKTCAEAVGDGDFSPSN